MLDPKLIRENPELVKTALENRQADLALLEQFSKCDQDWRNLLQECEGLKHQQNQLTPKGKPTPEQLESLKALSNEIKEKQDKLSEIEEDVKKLALQFPNIPHPTTPIGKDESDNPVLRQWGTPAQPDFEVLPHQDIGTQLGILDFETATKITGSRFVIYKKLGAKLERALINFMLDTHTEKHGYDEALPPVIVNSASMQGTGQLPKFADESFTIANTDFWLSPTAEVQLTNMYRDSIIPEDELPINVTAWTSCFRKEAGSYGKDLAGLIRHHQFNKVELVKIVKPENSEEELENLTANAEAILQALELPYQVIGLCTGDIGFSAAKTYDIEVWFPSQNKYREASSCSNFLDFQTRRAMIRYKDKTTGKVVPAHSLNGSGLAVGRIFASILENYQTPEGTIKVPKVLQPYMGLDEIK